MWILTKNQIKTKFSHLVMGNQDLPQLWTDYNNRRLMKIRIRKICNRWRVLARPKKESHLIKARKSKILTACKKILKAWQWVLKAPRRKSSRTWLRAKVKMKPKGARSLLNWKARGTKLKGTVNLLSTFLKAPGRLSLMRLRRLLVLM